VTTEIVLRCHESAVIAAYDSQVAPGAVARFNVDVVRFGRAARLIAGATRMAVGCQETVREFVRNARRSFIAKYEDTAALSDRTDFSLGVIKALAYLFKPRTLLVMVFQVRKTWGTAKTSDGHACRTQNSR
jgi:hypothetical protein